MSLLRRYTPPLVAMFSFNLLLLTAGCTTAVHLTTAAPPLERKYPSIAVIADPQIHNVYGVGLKQMTDGADLVSKVAIRPPELNLLAPLVLENLVEQATKGEGVDAPKLMLAVGDLSNIACSGEYELFLKSIRKAAPGMVTLFAHGNHDSYLMGTVSSYIPTNFADWLPPEGMKESPVPTDEHWWGTLAAPRPDSERNWKDGCFDCDASNPGSPMNKVRWLRKYVDLLDLEEVGAGPSTPDDRRQIPLTYRPKTGSNLAALSFHAEGSWFPPRFGKTPSKSDFTVSYKSFLVQQADMDTSHRLIVIDTSVKRWALGGWRFLWTHAGGHAKIGSDQFAIIRKLVEETPAEKHLTLAGHFPLGDLSWWERRKLLKILSVRTSWNYLSAHTHYSKQDNRGFGWANGFEINVGSTTDWPMVAHRVYLVPEAAIHPITAFRNPIASTISYTEPEVHNVAEVCRHLPVARLLAKLDPSLPLKAWRSPPPCSDCVLDRPDQWTTIGAELAELRATIERRFHDPEEKAYRALVLSIAAVASKHESESTFLSRLIP